MKDVPGTTGAMPKWLPRGALRSYLAKAKWQKKLKTDKDEAARYLTRRLAGGPANLWDFPFSGETGTTRNQYFLYVPGIPIFTF